MTIPWPEGPEALPVLEPSLHILFVPDIKHPADQHPVFAG